MPVAFSAALFEQIFAVRREVVVYLRRAAATRKDAEKRALKSVQLRLPTGTGTMSRIVPLKRLFFAFFDENPGVFAISVAGKKGDKKSARRGVYVDGQIFYACGLLVLPQR